VPVFKRWQVIDRRSLRQVEPQAQQSLQGPGLLELLSHAPGTGARRLRPWEVPLLDAKTQKEAIRRLREPGSPTNKLTLIRLLAFGGNGDVVEAFTQVLTHDYVSRHLTADENWALSATVVCLGVTARRHQEAVRFLEQAREPAYWRWVTLWTSPGDRDEPFTLRCLVGAAIKGLAWSGRPEADQMLAGYHDNPHSVERAYRGAVVDAACIRDLVRSVGFEQAWDMLQPLLGAGADAFVKWARDTSEGRDWMRWSAFAGQDRRGREDGLSP